MTLTPGPFRIQFHHKGTVSLGKYIDMPAGEQTLLCGIINMKWEYKTVKLKAKGFMGGKFDETQLDAMMNDLGRDGWELAAAFDTNEGYGATRDIVVIFKRPKG